jgi:hypothetical protein
MASVEACSAPLDRQPSAALLTTSIPLASAKACEAPHTDQDLCHYVLVRGDLTTGQKIAQTVHATGESVSGRVPKNTVAVALQVRDQNHLREYAARFTAAGIEHVVIAECDGELMAIGCAPTRDRQKIKKEVSSLPLVR